MMGPLTQDPSFKNRRRAAISKHATQMGIDYVELGSDHKSLKLYFIPKSSDNPNFFSRITISNIRIQSESGLEQNYIRAIKVTEDAKNVLQIDLEYNTDRRSSKDLPIYRLQLLNVPDLDPFFDQVHFYLETKKEMLFDPQAKPVEQQKALREPEIDYLAKDYSSFRQLMLNRLSLLMPQWKERQVGDLNMALIEVLAYAADRLSYYQDAVATEAYLNTARRRVSVRRHARLIDYVMHEGRNARVWVQVQVERQVERQENPKPDPDKDKLTLPIKSQLLTKVAGLTEYVLDEQSHQQALIEGAMVFETMEEKTFFREQNRIEFYTWGAHHFVLPQGSTSATLCGHLDTLKVGQLLIFQKFMGATTGKKADANPSHRHAVRLTEVRRGNDPLGDLSGSGPIEMTEIRWHNEDALPFALVVSNSSIPNQPITIARGNIVLADHGRTIEQEALIPPTVPTSGPYRLHLGTTDLTYSVPYDEQQAQTESAMSLFGQTAHHALPAITLTQKNGGQKWQALPDLLDAHRFTRGFVVEMESDRQAILRFGDDRQGKRPNAGDKFEATYRVGNGLAGNIGREAIGHLFIKEEPSPSHLKVSGVCNWLPAQGGIDPEPISEVRLYAPTTFKDQKRCVTEADYVAVVKAHPEVEDAATIFRWTGSWYTAIVVVRRQDDKPVDAAFQVKMQEYLERYRVAGYDINVRAPRFVSLDIVLTVHVDSTYFASTVKQRLVKAFSAVDLPSGERGFFHPKHFTFGQSVYLSHIIEHAVKIPGVVQVKAERFERWGRASGQKSSQDEIPILRLEIARVQNKSDAPQLGQIVFKMRGGRQ